MRHPMTVVDHPDQTLAALLRFNANRFRSCVQRVLQQLFDHRRRPFHNLTCGNLVGNSFRQYANTAHGRCSLGGRTFRSDVEVAAAWALAPEAVFAYRSGMGSKLSAPLTE